MSDLIYTRDNIIQREGAAQTSVWTKQSWQDALWTEQPFVYVFDLEFAIHGSVGTANLVHRYGRILQELGTQSPIAGYQMASPLDLEGYWVRINFTPGRVRTPDPTLLTNVRDGMVVLNTTSGQLERLNGSGGPGWVPATDLSETYFWYGVIVEQNDKLKGSDAGTAGDRNYVAYTLEYLLSKKQLFESKVRNPADLDAPDNVQRGIPFNGGRSDGRSSVNNLINNRGPKTSFTNNPPFGVPARPIFQFARDLKADDNAGDPDTDTHSGLRWTITEIVDYLLYWYPPTEATGPEWVLAAVSSAMDDFLYDFQFVDVEYHGRTMLDVLNQIFDRKRGLTWWLQPDEASGQVWLVVDSYSRNDLTSAGTTILPANARQYFLDWSGSRDNEDRLHIRTDTAQTYSEVICVGAQVGSVFTIDKQQSAASILVRNWPSTLESEYDEAYSGAGAPYDSLDNSRKESVNDTIRMSDKYRSVYTEFKIKESWDERTIGGDPVWPDYTDWDDVPLKASATPTQGLWLKGRRIQSYLLLRSGWDYTQDPPVDGNESGSQADFLRPIVVMQVAKTPHATVADSWVHVDRAHAEGINDELLSAGGEGIDFSCTIQPLNEQPGLKIQPGGLPHLIGPTSKAWDGATAGISDRKRSEADPDTTFATVYMTHDKQLSATAGSVSIRHDQQAVLRIDLGDRAHYDVLCPETVLDVSEDKTGLVKSPSEYVVLRDDRKILQDLANTALLWYSAMRISLDFSHRQIVGDYFVGSLIQMLKVSIGGDLLIGQDDEQIIGQDGIEIVGQGRPDVDVNSIISRVKHDFRELKTTVTTQFAEIDFAEF